MDTPTHTHTLFFTHAHTLCIQTIGSIHSIGSILSLTHAHTHTLTQKTHTRNTRTNTKHTRSQAQVTQVQGEDHRCAPRRFFFSRIPAFITLLLTSSYVWRWLIRTCLIMRILICVTCVWKIKQRHTHKATTRTHHKHQATPRSLSNTEQQHTHTTNTKQQHTRTTNTKQQYTHAATIHTHSNNTHTPRTQSNTTHTPSSLRAISGFPA